MERREVEIIGKEGATEQENHVGTGDIVGRKERKGGSTEREERGNINGQIRKHGWSE